MSAYCNYCHSSVYIDDEIQRLRYELDEDAGYEFEMGRIRAREEYEAKKRDDAERERNYKKRNELLRKQKAIEDEKARKKGCAIKFYKLLAWIFFFPFMLTYTIWKAKKIPLVIKIVLIIILWIFMYAIYLPEQAGQA